MQTYVFQRVVSFKSLLYSGFPVKVRIQCCIQFGPVLLRLYEKNEKEQKKKKSLSELPVLQQKGI